MKGFLFFLETIVLLNTAYFVLLNTAILCMSKSVAW